MIQSWKWCELLKKISYISVLWASFSVHILKKCLRLDNTDLFFYILELSWHYLLQIFVFVCTSSSFCTFLLACLCIFYFIFYDLFQVHVYTKTFFILIIPDLPFCELLLLWQQLQLFVHIQCRCCVFCCNNQQQQFTKLVVPHSPVNRYQIFILRHFLIM